jgi:hypothetical protein
MGRFPSADEIATAVVTACRLTGEDPVACVRGELGVRGRHVALDALLAAFPEARREGLGRCLGYGSPRAAQGNLIGARKLRWWRDDWADETLGALVASQYGERAQ